MSDCNLKRQKLKKTMCQKLNKAYITVNLKKKNLGPVWILAS